MPCATTSPRTIGAPELSTGAPCASADPARLSSLDDHVGIRRPRDRFGRGKLARHHRRRRTEVRDASPLLDHERRRSRADIAGRVGDAHRERVGAARQVRGQVDAKVLGRVVVEAIRGRAELPGPVVDGAVERSERGSDLRADRDDRGDLERTAIRDRAEGLAIDVLHDEVRRLVRGHPRARRARSAISVKRSRR